MQAAFPLGTLYAALPAMTLNKRIFVGILARRPDWRRLFVAILSVTAATLSAAAAPKAPARHPIDDITATAEAFLKERMGTRDASSSVSAAGFDTRHQLPRCDMPLQGFLRRGMEVQPRTIVGVRCSGSRPWKVYVPVDIVVTASVLVTKRALPRGHTVMPDDVRPERRDVSRLRFGYLADPAELQGQRLRAPLLAGKILTPAVLEIDAIVRRGQSVTLVAGSGGISVNMVGVALSDGGLNQRIRVENGNSGRIVEGVVRSREHVEVLLSAPSSFFHAKPKVSPPVADMRFSNNDR